MWAVVETAMDLCVPQIREIFEIAELFTAPERELCSM
jgi:hypothetical protein